jgi:hypothetical protein
MLASRANKGTTRARGHGPAAVEPVREVDPRMQRAEATTVGPSATIAAIVAGDKPWAAFGRPRRHPRPGRAAAARGRQRSPLRRPAVACGWRLRPYLRPGRAAAARGGQRGPCTRPAAARGGRPRGPVLGLQLCRRGARGVLRPVGGGGGRICVRDIEAGCHWIEARGGGGTRGQDTGGEERKGGGGGGCRPPMAAAAHSGQERGRR